MERLGERQGTWLDAGDGKGAPEEIFQGLETEAFCWYMEFLFKYVYTMFGVALNILQKNSKMVTIILF